MRRKRDFKNKYNTGGALPRAKLPSYDISLSSPTSAGLNTSSPNLGYDSDVFSPTDIAVNKNNVLGEQSSSFLDNINTTNALQYLPEALNLATGIFGKDETRPATQINQRSVGMMPDRINVNPQLQDIRSSYRAIIADPNASTPEKLAAQAQLNRTISSIYATKQNQESRMQANRAQLQAQLDRGQSRFDNQYREDKMISDANLGVDGNFARQALSSISSKYLQQKAIEAKKQQDKQAFMAIIKSLPKAAQDRLTKWYEV